MIIAGLQYFSLIDYPGKICAIVFTQGCNFRCPYCHNPELVDPNRFQQTISYDTIFSFLEKRKGKIDAVEITGGEPTIQNDLEEFVQKIKDMGYLVKLDTNGSNSIVLEQIISKNLIDYIAMDIKAPLKKYKEITGVNVDTEEIEKCINLITNSGLDYEFRTTCVNSLLSEEDILEIGEMIKGAKRYILQKLVPSKTLHSKFVNEFAFSQMKLECSKEIIKNYVDECFIR
ncbi:anaerobic ribonucleoside-triphosphate reductase activating protein [candidate division WOR-3 bacterium]|nr:anaerobic ribonucleoside-triphosphate reductase activating protein [candidate division WOR-3 bacterium]